MRRRDFIAGLGATAAWPYAVRAQQRPVPVVGYLDGYGGGDGVLGERRRAAMLKGLADTGFIEGRNVAIEYRLVVAGQEEKVPAILHELIERAVTILNTSGMNDRVQQQTLHVDENMSFLA
jgi:putative ABC transport system substrate-binding protein